MQPVEQRAGRIGTATVSSLTTTFTVTNAAQPPCASNPASSKAGLAGRSIEELETVATPTHHFHDVHRLVGPIDYAFVDIDQASSDAYDIEGSCPVKWWTLSIAILAPQANMLLRVAARDVEQPLARRQTTGADLKARSSM
jgi:hypothetical protein